MKTGTINTGVRIMSGVIRELSDRDRLVQAMNLRPSDDTIRRLAEFDLNASLIARLEVRKEFIEDKIRDANRSSRMSMDRLDLEDDLIVVETELEKLRTVKNT